MAHIEFWEKPGCKGNARQKEILLAAGHTLEVKNLLAEPWTEELLRAFFDRRPVGEWFNHSHPRIKAGEIVPALTTAEEALELMLKDPLFIVRPLMQVGGNRIAGFEVAQVDRWVGLDRTAIGPRDPRYCPCVQKPLT